MSTPTRQEIIDAHEALADMRALAESNPPRHDTHAEKLESHIFAALPPLPQPTMAEVEWDDDLHYLAEAEHPIWRTVIMLGLGGSELIEVFVPHLSEHRYRVVRRETTTPTGRRYTLTEVQE